MIGPVPSDRWEREVRRQLLKQLPANWIVICNVSWALKDDSGSVRDGQADFVVLAPELGLAVVEVKGSKSVRVNEDGMWLRRKDDNSEVVLKESPPEQATRNLHTLAQVVKKELSFASSDYFPGLHAWLVVYPNGKIEGIVNLYDESTIVSKSQMYRLGGAIKGALLAKGSESTGNKFTQELANSAAEILTNQRFRVVSVDTELDTQKDEHEIDELTRQQFAALRGAFDLPRVAIIGPAGSGKTLLAFWKLSALLEEGKKAIFVCFNKRLAESLKIKHPSMASAIFSIDSLFWGLAGNYTVSTDREKQDFYSTILPGMVMDGFYKDNDKYDAIIIDEGQDFGDDRIVALYQLLRDGDNSQWLYFGDEKQDLYKQGTNETLGAEVTFRLYHNCRNTELVNAATNNVCRGAVKPMPGVPSGEVPNASLCKVDYMAQKAWDLINELSADGGAVILSPYKLEKSCMDVIRKAYGLTLTEDISKLGEPGFVFYSTIKSFKGLEARHVIFVHADMPGMNPALAEEDMYVAFTRATARLDILTANPAAMSWFKDKLELIS
jgi:hypothetical protein